MTPSLLQTEILQQPAALRTLIDSERQHITAIGDLIRSRSPRFIMLVARGSSDNAARYGQYLFSTINHLPTALAIPSAYTIYQQAPRLEDAAVIAISQSGQSPDIVAVVEESRRQDVETIAITNDPESPLANAADHTINLSVGKEFAVAATKTYSASLVALALLSASIAGDNERLAAIDHMPQWIAEVTQHCDATMRAAERYCYIQYCVVASRGYNYATAYEIALKLKELTYVIAEPYSSADFQHGPVALVDHGFPVVAVVPDGPLAGELTAFFRDLAKRGAELIMISADPEALALGHTALPLPAGVPEWLSPAVAIVQGQMFALGLAIAKRFDPDRPRHIGKVTLTL